MTGISEVTKMYLSLGAGGAAVIVILWLVHFLVTKIHPILGEIKRDSSTYMEVVRNNTRAVDEVSRSNDNIATALSVLNGSFVSLTALMDKHNNRAERIENEIIKVRESTRDCVRRRFEDK